MSENKRWIDERTYEILHNEYDEYGELVGQVWKQFKTNETATHIYITDEFIKQQAKSYTHKGSTSVSSFGNFDKTVVYETNGEELKTMKFENTNGNEVEVTLEFKNEKSKLFIFPMSSLK